MGIIVNKAPIAGQQALQMSSNTTSAQIFQLQANSAALNPALACALYFPSGKKYDSAFTNTGAALSVRACGYVTTGATLNVTATLYGKQVIPAPGAAGSTAQITPANWTTLCASTARAVNSASSPWMIEAVVQWDSVSGIMHGKFTAEINNLLDNWAALSSTLTGLTDTGNIGQSSQGEPLCWFAVGITMSVANAANIAQLGSFELLEA
jgi:hypothetical protein